MKHIELHFEKNNYSNAQFDFYFKNLKLGVLDIETTGLNPSRNKFILGGLYSMTNGLLHQFLAENREDEHTTLEAFVSEINKLDAVITYNGRRFDLPFLMQRMEVHNIKGKLPYNLDLYLTLKSHSPIKKFLPNLKQKTIENYMGLWQDRKDEISGGESVELYNTYEKTGDKTAEEKILLHNSDDVLQLSRLIKVIEKSDFHGAMFSQGFPLRNLVVEKIEFSSNSLLVRGIQVANPIDYRGFTDGRTSAEVTFIKKSQSFFFKIPVINHRGMIIADLKALNTDEGKFYRYPDCGSGMLVLKKDTAVNYMETNHFVKEFILEFLTGI